MKVESPNSDTGIPGDSRDGSFVDSDDNAEITGVGVVSHACDLQASLGMINGYSHALKSSFDELKDQYGDVLERKVGESVTTSNERLMTLEANCRFCLTRLCHSVDQLRQRLEVDGVLRETTPD